MASDTEGKEEKEQRPEEGGSRLNLGFAELLEPSTHADESVPETERTEETSAVETEEPVLSEADKQSFFYEMWQMARLGRFSEVTERSECYLHEDDESVAQYWWAYAQFGAAAMPASLVAAPLEKAAIKLLEQRSLPVPFENTVLSGITDVASELNRQQKWLPAISLFELASKYTLSPPEGLLECYESQIAQDKTRLQSLHAKECRERIALLEGKIAGLPGGVVSDEAEPDKTSAETQVEKVEPSEEQKAEVSLTAVSANPDSESVTGGNEDTCTDEVRPEVDPQEDPSLSTAAALGILITLMVVVYFESGGAEGPMWFAAVPFQRSEQLETQPEPYFPTEFSRPSSEVPLRPAGLRQKPLTSAFNLDGLLRSLERKERAVAAPKNAEKPKEASGSSSAVISTEGPPEPEYVREAITRYQSGRAGSSALPEPRIPQVPGADAVESKGQQFMVRGQRIPGVRDGQAGSGRTQRVDRFLVVRKTPVKQYASDFAPTIATLRPSHEVVVVKREGNWYRIESDTGRAGYIPLTAVERKSFR